MATNDQNGVPVGGLAPWKKVAGKVCTVPFRQPFPFARVSGQTFYDDLQSYASVAALDASGYNDSENGPAYLYAANRIAQITPPLAITPEPLADGESTNFAKLALPIYFDAPASEAWVRVDAALLVPATATTGAAVLSVQVMTVVGFAGAGVDVGGLALNDDFAAIPAVRTRAFGAVTNGPDVTDALTTPFVTGLDGTIRSLVVYVGRPTATTCRLLAWLDGALIADRTSADGQAPTGDFEYAVLTPVVLQDATSEAPNQVISGALSLPHYEQRPGLSLAAGAAYFGVTLPA